MRVLSVGAGAVGGTIAARLRRAGHDITVFDSNADHVALLREPGLVVEGLDDGVPVTLDAATSLGDAPPDLVLLAVRSAATTDALDAVSGVIGEDTDVVSLQNGLNEDRIAAVVGAHRTIGCVVGFGATWIEPGRIHLDASGELVLGRLDGALDERLERARDVLGDAFPTRVTDNVLGALWSKMLVNSMTVLGALGGMLTRDLLSTPQRRSMIAGVIAEGIRVARSSGVRLERVLGTVDADAVDASSYAASMDAVLVRFGERYGAIRSVTWRDFEIGRPTEIDAVTGEIVRRGETTGVPTPINANVYAMLKEIESGMRSPDPANLEAAVAPAM